MQIFIFAFINNISDDLITSMYVMLWRTDLFVAIKYVDIRYAYLLMSRRSNRFPVV